MPRKGSKVAKQDYKYIAVVYPDSTSYSVDAVIADWCAYFSVWAYCMHDRDVGKDGKPLKPHYHLYGRKTDDDGHNCPVTLSCVASNVGLDNNAVEYARSEKASIRYLIHADDDDKVRYSMDDISTNISLSKYFRDFEPGKNATKIYNYIVGNSVCRVTDVIPWILENNLYADFRRGYAIWDTLMREMKGKGE